MEIINTIGRRKTSIARVYVKPGKGEITVNDRALNDYFKSEILQTTVKQAITLVKADGQYDVTVNVEGGGNKRSGRSNSPGYCPRPCYHQYRKPPSIKEGRFINPRFAHGGKKETRA
jgi:hypothetical protein